MKIVKSNSVELALDPLSVYFFIGRGRKVNKNIDSLNQSAAYTLGLYSYKTLHRSEVNDSIPSQEICDAIENHNVVVRLFNGEDDCYIYAFENIDVSLPKSALHSSVHAFILDVAKRNIALLEQEIRRESKSGGVNSDAIVKENREVVSLLHQRIVQAERLYMSNLRGVVREISCSVQSDFRSIPGVVVPKLRTAVKKTQPKSLEQEITALVNTIKEQDVLVNAIVELFNNRLKSQSVVENDTDTSTAQPTITVGCISVNKYNRKTNRYGIIVTVNGEKYNIVFGSTDATMLYISALLRYKAGVPLYLYELYNNSHRIVFLTERMDRRINNWLSDIYNCIITKSSKSAAEWLVSIKTGRPIHQAKSSANSSIKSAMSGNPASELCLMQTKIDENKNTYYSFGCPRENIIIDEHLLPLLDSVPVTPLFK